MIKFFLTMKDTHCNTYCEWPLKKDINQVMFCFLSLRRNVEQSRAHKRNAE